MNANIPIIPDVQPTSPVRIGVVVCECGRKIGGVIDTELLCQHAAKIPGVVSATHEPYPCSRDGQERLLQTIEEEGLDRVLIAGCSPRLVRSMFRNTCHKAGLARSFVNLANIREQCAYIHLSDPATALAKATGLVEMGIARLSVATAEQTRTGRLVRAALLVGSDLGGLTVTQSLVEAGIPVTLVEAAPEFGAAVPHDLLHHTRQQTIEKGELLLAHPLVTALFNARVVEVTGHPGDYLVRINQGGTIVTKAVGAIVVANAARTKPLGDGRWYDRGRVKTQAEFEDELNEYALKPLQFPHKDLVFVLCAEESQLKRCSRVCCNIGIRQAIRAKRLNPQANVTILFRDLYLGGIGGPYENILQQARTLGVTFFRYRIDRPPAVGRETVDVLDTLTGEPVRVPFDRVVLSMPLVPAENTPSLSSLLSLPVDEDGFLAEPRTRLRPGRYAEPGIYVLGSAQQPVDTDEGLFQAFLTTSRVRQFLSREPIKMESPAAQIDASLCTGCGNCTQVCPGQAIKLEKQDGVLSLSEVDALRCTGCGNCVVVCPVRAISLPGWDTTQIPVQISAALNSRSFHPSMPKIVVLACEWSAYSSADMAGARHLEYPANVRIIRTNCSARFDPYHILWAFLNGADGVYLGACPPGECHYGNGNLYAFERVEILKSELEQHGVDSRRIHLEFLSVDDGPHFAHSLQAFVQQIQTEVARPQPA